MIQSIHMFGKQIVAPHFFSWTKIVWTSKLSWAVIFFWGFRHWIQDGAPTSVTNGVITYHYKWPIKNKFHLGFSIYNPY